jgi:heme/copper-type cytochrome/quinol oxidase subunit 3
MITWLTVVILCSLGFLGIKAVEYTSKINEGLWVGNFDYAKANRFYMEHHGGHSAKGGIATWKGLPKDIPNRRRHVGWVLLFPART